jgi:hypothetical protein
VEAEGDRISDPKGVYKNESFERTKRTGGSNTFILIPSDASIFMYVSSSANYRER